MTSKIFVDTNILIYAYVDTNDFKHKKAQEVLYCKIFDDTMLLSTQILYKQMIERKLRIINPLLI